PPGAPKTVLISDPVAKTDYMLNLQEQTARAVKRENGKAIFIEQSGKSDGEQKARQESEQKIKIKLNAERAGAVGMAVSHLAEPGNLRIYTPSCSANIMILVLVKPFTNSPMSSVTSRIPRSFRSLRTTKSLRAKHLPSNPKTLSSSCWPGLCARPAFWNHPS